MRRSPRIQLREIQMALPSDIPEAVRNWAYRLLDHSKRQWQQGEDMLQSGYAEYAANRMYYALLYAAWAWKVVDVKAEMRIDHQVAAEFVDSKLQGRPMPECSYPTKYRNLKSLRNRADYADQEIDASAHLAPATVSEWKELRELVVGDVERTLEGGFRIAVSC